MARPDTDALRPLIQALWALIRPEMRRFAIECVIEAQRARTWSTQEVARHYGMSVPALRARLRRDAGLWTCIDLLPQPGSQRRPRLRWHIDRLERYLHDLAEEQREAMGWTR